MLFNVSLLLIKLSHRLYIYIYKMWDFSRISFCSLQIIKTTVTIRNNSLIYPTSKLVDAGRVLLPRFFVSAKIRISRKEATWWVLIFFFFDKYDGCWSSSGWWKGNNGYNGTEVFWVPECIRNKFLYPLYKYILDLMSIKNINI